MKRMLTALILAMGLTVAAHAGTTYNFTFNSPDLKPAEDGANGAAAVEAYMEGVYGADITVSTTDGGQIVFGDASNPFGTGKWIRTNGGPGNPDALQISFNDRPIDSVSFGWVSSDNAFVGEADGAVFFSQPESLGQAFGTTTTFNFVGGVTTLSFHDGGSGWVGIDNLKVTAVPAPAALVLAGLGTGLVGWIRKRRAAV